MKRLLDPGVMCRSVLISRDTREELEGLADYLKGKGLLVNSRMLRRIIERWDENLIEVETEDGA